MSILSHELDFISIGTVKLDRGNANLIKKVVVIGTDSGLSILFIVNPNS